MEGSINSLKTNLISFLNIFSGYIPLKCLIKCTGQKIFSPFYHIISDNAPIHVKHIYPIRTSNLFIKDIEYLQKHFEFIDLNTFIDLSAKKKLDKRYCFLSFDDGLSEFYNLIAPILKQKGIPAHIFLNSAFVDNKDLMFRYKVSILYEAYLNSNLKNKVDEILQKQIDSNTDTKNRFLELKYHNIDIINEIAEALEIDFNEYLKTNKPYITTEQINELKNDGFTFGAHSIDHPEYRYINIEEQINQTKQSLEFVQKEFNPSCKSFAFPFTDFDVTLELFNKLKEQKIVDYTFGGAGLKKEKIISQFQRFPMEGNLLKAKKLINTEYLYYLIKMPFGKNIIKR